MKKPRAPDLTDERIAEITELLDSWQARLTWTDLIEAVQLKTGVEYSRFTLAGYARIANAFQLRKAALRGVASNGTSAPRDLRLRGALDQIRRLEAKAARLETENRLLTEQFITWATNAEQNGVTIAMLNKPLPKPPRERSDD